MRPLTAGATNQSFVTASTGSRARPIQRQPSYDEPTPLEIALQESIPDEHPLANAASSGLEDVGASTPVGVAGATLPSGNFEFPESVANYLRETDRAAAEADLTESVESGIYSPEAMYTAERFTPDQMVEFAEQGLRPEAYAEEGLASPLEFSHVPGLAGGPPGGSGVLTDPADHFFGQHAGNYGNDPGEFANPDWETDAQADEMFGEGSNLRIAEEGEDLGMTEGSEALDTGEGLVETAGESTELAEGLGLAGEATEGFEVADLLLGLLVL